MNFGVKVEVAEVIVEREERVVRQNIRKQQRQEDNVGECQHRQERVRSASHIPIQKHRQIEHVAQYTEHGNSWIDVPL